jgi:hypothetical protein
VQAQWFETIICIYSWIYGGILSFFPTRKVSFLHCKSLFQSLVLKIQGLKYKNQGLEYKIQGLKYKKVVGRNNFISTVSLLYI